MPTPRRKTFEVDAFRKTVNAHLALSDALLGATTPHAGETARIAMASVLESVLFKTGNYAGFRYLDSEYLPAPDIHGNVLRPDFDPTRRYYH